jgi:hypothetical protein
MDLKASAETNRLIEINAAKAETAAYVARIRHRRRLRSRNAIAGLSVVSTPDVNFCGPWKLL